MKKQWIRFGHEYYEAVIIKDTEKLVLWATPLWHNGQLNVLDKILPFMFQFRRWETKEAFKHRQV